MILHVCFLLGPTVPRSVVNTSATDTTVTLSWMPPDPPNGIITDYQVQYRSGDDSDMQQNTMNDVTNYKVTGLVNNTEYEFQVGAFTAVGGGLFSDKVTARTSKSIIIV